MIRAFGLGLLLLASIASHAQADDADSWGRAAKWLASQQDAKGALPSRHYGYLKSGFSLTATNAYALSLAPDDVRARHAKFFRRALAWIESGTDDEGAIGLEHTPVGYPTYSSAFTLLALERIRPAGWERRVALQRTRLLSLQHDEDLGWSKDDPIHGGFSFVGRTGQKPVGEGSTNISVTAFVIEALQKAGVDPGGREMLAARAFVLRCRSSATKDETRGFHFATFPPEYRSKANSLDDMDDTTTQFIAYGSTTADGIRALLAAGVKRNDRAIVQALAWIRRRFESGELNPGFPESKRHLADGIHLYWLMAAARALDAAGETRWDWRTAIRTQVLKCQQADGSFLGRSSLMKEDDPLVATPLALMALAASQPRK